MSEKVGKPGQELWRVNVSSHGRKNLQESNVLPGIFFFSLPKEGHDVISHVIRAS